MLRSAGVRFLIVGLLALFMFIPLFFVGEIIGERAEYSRQTIESVGEEWGGRQVISGPRLVLPVQGPQTRVERRESFDARTGAPGFESVTVTEIVRRGDIFVYPGRFDVTVQSQSDIRHRGLFEVPVYAATATMLFDFSVTGAENLLGEGETILWDEAAMDLSLTSNRALRGVAQLTVDGAEVAMEPRAAGEFGGITARLGDPRDLGEMRLDLGFNGAETLMIAPVGRNSAIDMQSDWPHPSFTGAFLPDGSEVSDAGFTARWTIPHLARGLPQMSRDDNDRLARIEALGVRFFQPNDFYQKAYRAARYGILFIALTFLSVLLIEGRRGTPAHPVQYILIGLAQSVFVLLMVAYAEQIGFGAAYALSAGATIVLLVLFGWSGLKLGRRTLVLGLMLLVLYGVLYLILQSADYALLAGSTLAFGALAVTMYATRNEDWYGAPKGERRSGLGGLFAGPPAPASPPPWVATAGGPVQRPGPDDPAPDFHRPVARQTGMIPPDAEARRAVAPVICYPTAALPRPDLAGYAASREGAVLIDTVIVPPRDARCFRVAAGQFFRITSVEGPQVGDLNLWHAGDLSERFYSGKTRALHGTHLDVGDRMWSGFPQLRAMATVVADTLDWYGFDGFGGGVHDVIGTRCDPYTGRLLSAGDYHNCCHSNLTRALAEASGLSLRDAEPLVHDVLNVFMCTGFTRDTGQYFMKASPVRPGDHIEFFAEIDLLGGLSACPGGDCGAEHSSDTAPCFPLQVEVFAPQAPPAGWSPPRPNAYDRSHGR